METAFTYNRDIHIEGNVMNLVKIASSTYKKCYKLNQERRARHAFSQKMAASLKYHQNGWKTQFENLEKKTMLTETQKQQVSDLWQSRYPAPAKFTYQFHEFYTQATGHFDSHYIPDDLYINLIDAWFNNRRQAKILDNKCLYAKLLPNAKQPITIAYRMSNVLLNAEYNIIKLDDLVDLLTGEKEVVVKFATNSMGGHGVFFFDGEDLTRKVFDSLSENNRDLVIQKMIIQHPTLAKLNPESVNTVRHLTFLENGKSTVYSSILRMGINHSRVDNASSGGITCGITNDGRLKSVAYAVSGKKYEKHPSSGIAFDTITVPSFEKSLRFVEDLHQSLPFCKLISWDIAIDQNGDPVLLETNLYKGELDFHQLNNGPLFGEDQDRILSMINWEIPDIYYPKYDF